jgi:hypothetical protein
MRWTPPCFLRAVAGEGIGLEAEDDIITNALDF